MAVGGGGKARIGREILPPQALQQHRPLAILLQQREDQPASVPAAIVVGHGIERLLPRRPLGDFCAAEPALHPHPLRPPPLPPQRGPNVPTPALSLPPLACTDPPPPH